MVELIFDKDEDWEKRTLCIDESCVGTIGPDGRCRECGKPCGVPLNPATDAADKNKEPAAPVDNLKTNTENAVPDEEWEKRVLCSDETCIGTIGPDGRCRECGKPSK